MEAARARVLDRRTAALATRVKASGDAAQVLRPQVIWSLGGSLFGLDPEAVAAVIPYSGCTAVPGRQPACLGVISRMGRFYSVIDPRRLMTMPENTAAEAAPAHLLLLRGASPHLALAVDRVLGHFDVTEPASSDGAAMIAGSLADIGGRLVSLLILRDLLKRLGHAA